MRLSFSTSVTTAVASFVPKHLARFGVETRQVKTGDFQAMEETKRFAITLE